ncbi:MAG TPA: ABC transporter ATP-binding protein [Patescibacteria group bacterium]|nr:ABC transporter ATP-binding protein [Patescibacteria group bacterium]
MDLLTLKDLNISFMKTPEPFFAVRQLTVSLALLSRTAIIGESGCGKSILAAALLGILPHNATVSGSIFWQGTPLTPDLLRRIRGRELALIPQNPAASLNPTLSVGFQVAETLALTHANRHGGKLRDQVFQLLSQVGLDAKVVYTAYPHQLSGGMAQRVLLAIALGGSPRLLIADEPTKGLDPAVRTDNMLLLHQCLVTSALLLITHDLELAATCEQVMVMHAGEVVEIAAPERLYAKPRHIYTRALLSAHPANGLLAATFFCGAALDQQPGCKFAAHCQLLATLSPTQRRQCRQQAPTLRGSSDWQVRCHYA